MQEMAREMERTTFVRKVLTDIPAPAVLERAQEFFREQGYRATKGGQPNTVRLQGRAEGALPAVIGEIGVRTTNRGRTIVSLSGYGERLQAQLLAFHDEMRAARAPKEARPLIPADATPPAAQQTRTRAEELEEELLEAAEAEGKAITYEREKYETGEG